MRIAKIPNPYGELATWTARMLDASEKTAAQLGVSPEAIVAQAALESGWGKAAIGNNVFGIKADASWTGKHQLVTTREFANGQYITIQAAFRDYDTLDEGIEDHFQFLRVNRNYSNLFTKSHTDQEYFNLLQQDGYATDPNYAMTLSEMLDSVKKVGQYIQFYNSEVIA